MWVTLKNSVLVWKIILALLVTAFLAGMALTFFLTARRAESVAGVDYYALGLRYGKTRNGLPNAGTGWRISPSLAGQELRVTVSDSSGSPVHGGALSFEPDKTGPAAPAPVQLAESAPGVFSAPRPLSPQGELHGTLHFTRGDDSASRKLVLLN